MIKITMTLIKVWMIPMISCSHLFLRPSFHSTLDVAPGALKNICNYGKKLENDDKNITMRVEEKKAIYNI